MTPPRSGEGGSGEDAQNGSRQTAATRNAGLGQSVQAPPNVRPPPVGSLIGSSEPTPEEPLRRGGAQGGSGSNPPNWIPNRGVQGELVQSDAAVNSITSRGVVQLERRIIVFAFVDVTVRGCNECPSSEGRTQPRDIVLALHCVYGGGGLLKKPLSWPRLPRQLESLSWTSDSCERASSRCVEGTYKDGFLSNCMTINA